MSPTDPTGRADRLADGLRDASFRVDSVEQKAVTERPKPPFTTSTLQQEAARKLGFSVFWIRPMRIASGSSSPRLPVVSLRRCSLSRKARSSSGLDVGVANTPMNTAF